MKFIKVLTILLFVVFFSSCDENTYPRPRGNVRLEYPMPQYSLYNTDELKMSFNKSDYAVVEKKDSSWINLSYPRMKAKLHLSYFDVDGNINGLIGDIQKLTDEHKIKASGIIPHQYTNDDQQVYGVVYEFIGNSASNIQFYVTDSTKHLVFGSLYFRARPNSDSLKPAVNYIKKDIVTLLESLKWNN
jgi:gliding motility-associated lipoprotein GldD